MCIYIVLYRIKYVLLRFISSLAQKYFIYVIVLNRIGCNLQHPGDRRRNAMLLRCEGLKELYNSFYLSQLRNSLF